MSLFDEKFEFSSHRKSAENTSNIQFHTFEGNLNTAIF